MQRLPSPLPSQQRRRCRFHCPSPSPKTARWRPGSETTGTCWSPGMPRTWGLCERTSYSALHTHRFKGRRKKNSQDQLPKPIPASFPHPQPHMTPHSHTNQPARRRRCCDGEEGRGDGMVAPSVATALGRRPAPPMPMPPRAVRPLRPLSLSALAASNMMRSCRRLKSIWSRSSLSWGGQGGATGGRGSGAHDYQPTPCTHHVTTSSHRHRP